MTYKRIYKALIPETEANKYYIIYDTNLRRIKKRVREIGKKGTTLIWRQDFDSKLNYIIDSVII